MRVPTGEEIRRMLAAAGSLPDSAGAGPGPRSEGLSDAELRAYRFLVVLGGAAAVAFWWLHHLVNPGADDPLALRLALLALGVIQIGASFLPGARRWFLPSTYALFGICTLWFIWLGWRNGFARPYGTGLMLVFGCVVTAFRHRSAYLSYAAVTLGALGLALFAGSANDRYGAYLFASAALLLVAGYVMLQGRWRAEERLRDSETLREILLGQASEALVILDPVRRLAVEANGQAARMFGAATAADPKALAVAVFGQPHWLEIDAALVLKEVAGHGEFRRELRYAGAAGSAGTEATLRVTSVRLRHRPMLLAQITAKGADPAGPA